MTYQQHLETITRIGREYRYCKSIASDEVTCSLHAILRFELERDYFAGRLTAGEMADAWNEKYREYLGVCPPDDTQGVLQDMHWAGDYIGYFQSYALGNINDGQILAALKRDLPAWQEEIRKGNFAPSTAGWASTSGSGAAASRRGSWCSGLPAAPWMQNLSCAILTANTPPSTALRPNRRTPGKNGASSIQGRLSAAKPGKLRILSGKPKNRVYFSRLV